MMKLIGSIDRISDGDVYIIIDNENEDEICLPAAWFPEEIDEGMTYTIEIERNLKEEQRLKDEIECLKQSLT